MAAKDWRMVVPCNTCPFNASGPGLRLRRSLEPGRWPEILQGLRAGTTFHCHKTTVEGEGEGEDGEMMAGPGSKLCAGATAYQERHGCTSNYQRVCETLDAFSKQRASRGKR